MSVYVKNTLFYSVSIPFENLYLIHKSLDSVCDEKLRDNLIIHRYKITNKCYLFLQYVETSIETTLHK